MEALDIRSQFGSVASERIVAIAQQRDRHPSQMTAE
jgi:hypothetical protein